MSRVAWILWLRRRHSALKALSNLPFSMYHLGDCSDQ
jgi:hypothetical protein